MIYLMAFIAVLILILVLSNETAKDLLYSTLVFIIKGALIIGVLGAIVIGVAFLK